MLKKDYTLSIVCEQDIFYLYYKGGPVVPCGLLLLTTVQTDTSLSCSTTHSNFGIRGFTMWKQKKIQSKNQVMHEQKFKDPLTPYRNFSNFFLKTMTSVISVQILVWVSIRMPTQLRKESVGLGIRGYGRSGFFSHWG